MRTASRVGALIGVVTMMVLGVAGTVHASDGLATKTSDAASVPPVSTTAVGCDSQYHLGPYWYAGVDASKKAGKRMVMDIQGPWTTPGTRAHMWTWYNGPSQYWCLDPTLNGSAGGTFYMVRNYHTGLCLEAGSMTNGATVTQQECGRDYYRQNWWITAKGSYSTPDGTETGYQFSSLDNYRYCLDVKAFGSSDGTPLQIWSCSGGLNQRFY